MSEPKTRGGKREGAGRPKTMDDAQPYKSRLPLYQREWLAENGGAQTIRDLIDKAMGRTG